MRKYSNAVRGPLDAESSGNVFFRAFRGHLLGGRYHAECYLGSDNESFSSWLDRHGRGLCSLRKLYTTWTKKDAQSTRTPCSTRVRKVER